MGGIKAEHEFLLWLTGGIAPELDAVGIGGDVSAGVAYTVGRETDSDHRAVKIERTGIARHLRLVYSGGDVCLAHDCIGAETAPVISYRSAEVARCHARGLVFLSLVKKGSNGIEYRFFDFTVHGPVLADTSRGASEPQRFFIEHYAVTGNGTKDRTSERAVSYWERRAFPFLVGIGHRARKIIFQPWLSPLGRSGR